VVIGLSLEVLSQIREAEAKAEDVKQEAQREARDMIKSVESACAAAERSAAVEHRGMYQQLMEGKRQEVMQHLKENRVAADAKVASEMKQAEERLDQAANLIFERVVKHGNC
jgi:vacuolar-type H+-ATPase subunit H